MASITDILSALQNGVTGINSLNKTLGAVFPGATTLGVTAPSSTGNTLTFLSSQPKGWMAITTSSGYAGYIAVY